MFESSLRSVRRAVGSRRERCCAVLPCSPPVRVNILLSCNSITLRLCMRQSEQEENKMLGHARGGGGAGEECEQLHERAGEGAE